MFKKITTSITALLTGVVLFGAVSAGVPAVAFAAAPPATPQNTSLQNNLSCGANLDASNIGGDGSACAAATTTGAGSVNSLLTTTINIFSLVVGIIAVIMLIFGGLKYITSGGDSSKVGTAKNTIVFAIVGLVIVALAQVIVQFVLTKANPSTTGTGTPVVGG
jgi:Type IV secretion system pilin